MLKYILLFLFTILLISCEGPTGPNGKDAVDGKDGDYDKQIRVVFPFNNYGTYSTNWELLENYTYLTRFNKTSFVNVDSIIFAVSMASDIGDSITTDTSYIELYNITDSISISGSQIKTVSVSYNLLETENIYNNIPEKEITLAIRLRRSNSDGWCYIRTPQLLLYRK